jgi:ribonucleoside-diphosphate reductase alpha chain
VTTVPATSLELASGPRRRPLPRRRRSHTVSFRVGDSEGTLTAGTHPDGELGEIFLRLGKQGSTLSGLAEAFSIVFSLAVQHGVPVELITDRLRGSRFEPAGLTDDHQIPNATSIIDYVAHRLAADFANRPESLPANG